MRRKAMYYPELRWQARCIRGDLHFSGALLRREEDIAKMNQIFDILSAIKPMDIDDAKYLWFPLPRGTADDYWNYEDSLACGECTDREDFERQFASEFPDEVYWFSFSVRGYRGYRTIFLDRRPLFTYDPENGSRSSGVRCVRDDEAGPILDFLIEKAREIVRQVEEGSYNCTLEREFPLERRSGVVPRDALYRAYPQERLYFLRGLSDEEVAQFCAFAQDGEPITHVKDFTAGMYYKLVDLCYEAIDPEHKYFRSGMSAKERYSVYADGRDNDLKKIDDDDPEAYLAWHKDTHEGHAWEIISGHSPYRLHLFTRRDDDGWRLSIGTDQLLKEAVRSYNALRQAGWVVELYPKETFLDALLERDWVCILTSDTFVYGGKQCCGKYCHTARNLEAADLGRPEFLSQIEWEPLRKAELKGEGE